MKLLEDLRAILVGFTGVTNVTEVNPKSNDECIRPERLFETDQLPAIALSMPDSGPQNDLGAFNKTYSATVLVSCCGASSKAANDLAEIVNNNLEPFTGATSHGEIDAVVIDGERTGFEPFAEGSDKGIYITELRFIVFYRQTS